MKTAYLRPEEARDRASLHAALARQLGFPDWYGGNLDALRDLLGAERGMVQIVLVHPDELRENLGDCYDALLCVLRDARDDGANVRVLTWDW